MSNDIDGDPLAVIGVTQPTNGMASINADGTVKYTPNANFHGNDTFTYTISDIGGAIASATVHVSVTPVNDAPVAQNDAEIVSKNGLASIYVLVNDSDVDLDPLSVTTVGTAAHGTAAVAGGGSYVTYTPDKDYVGHDSFTYTISDGNGGTATATVNIDVLVNGQWATSVLGRSDDWNYDPYAWIPRHALGRPDTFGYGDIETAWATAPEDPEDGATDQWITLGFDKADDATAVKVTESTFRLTMHSLKTTFGR